MNITETAKLYAAQIGPEIDAHAARAAQTPSGSWPGSRLYRQNAQSNRGNGMTEEEKKNIAAQAKETKSGILRRVYQDRAAEIMKGGDA